MNKVSKGDSSIWCQSLFESTQLAWIDEIVQNHMKLKMLADDFLDKLF